MTQGKKILLIIGVVALLILLVAIILICVMFVPLKGKKHEEIWDKNQQFDLKKDTFVLQKQKEKDFVITQLTDMQLWSNGADNDKAFEVAKQVIEKTKPDLVVLTGDNVSGVFADSKLKRIIEFFENQAKEHNFYWATVFGNHDNEVKVTKNWSSDQYEKVSIKNGGRCLFAKGPSNLGDEYGSVLANYVIVVKEQDKIVQTLYMLDNSDYADYAMEDVEKAERRAKERPLTKAQVEWCKWNAENINKIAGKVVPSLCFTHFAPYEMGNALQTYVAGKDGKINTQDDIAKNDYDLWEINAGEKTENGILGIRGSFAYVSGYALFNTGAVDTLKPLGLKGWFVGHDHENDIIFEYQDVVYGYGLKTGPSPKPWNGAKCFGGTSIVMDEFGKITAMHHITDNASDYWKK